MRWLVDFAAAEKVGMGIRIVLPPELVDTKLDTLLVFGVRSSLTPAAAATELEALLDAQRYTRGLAFLAPGTPTNNTAEASTGFTSVDRDAGGSFESVPAAAEEGLRRRARRPAARHQRAACSPASRAPRGRTTSTRGSSRPRSGR